MMTYADATETLYKGRLDGRHFRALNPPGTYYWQAANVDSLGGPPGTYDTTPVRSFTVVPKAAPAPVAPRTANPVRSTECRNALNKRDFMNGAVRRAKSNLARARAARSKRIQRSLLRSRYRQLRYAKMRVNAFC